MESGTDGAWSKGALIPVSERSDVFQNRILAPLQNAYLYEESKQCFTYESAVLINNPVLEEKYNGLRAQKREMGYSKEDLKETYGFMLLDDISEANALTDVGVLNGNSKCTTLGDPSKGVYVSTYSDCLDVNRCCHGKSGYIAIIRLTQGRVKKVSENYTQSSIAPTVGFDCHVSEQLLSVSDKTNSLLLFERTQCYVYEMQADGSNETAPSPSLVYPFAVVSFSYTERKPISVAPQEKRQEIKHVRKYFPWRGQLQIGTKFYDVALKSSAGAMIPAQLPPVVKVDRAISMSDLRRLFPRAVFESCFSGEVPMDGLYFVLCELVSSVAGETSTLSVLLQEMKEKDLALIVPLNDGGFLILLHPSHFLTYDTDSNATEVLQGMFVFPDSRVIETDIKSGQRRPQLVSSKILRILPVLSYAEGKVEKTHINPKEGLCDVFVHHMQNYAAMINPGLTLSPSKKLSIFPHQYDVPGAHKHLYSSSDWTKSAWQSFRLYLNKPVSFQLPVSQASDILAAGQDERREQRREDLNICPSSPEKIPAKPFGMGSEDQLLGQKSCANVDTSVDSCVPSAEAQTDLTAVSQNVASNDLQAGDAKEDSETSDLTVLIKTDNVGLENLQTPRTSQDLPAELIVSITSEQTVPDKSLVRVHSDLQLSTSSTDKLQMSGGSSLTDKTVNTRRVLDCSTVKKARRRNLHWGHAKCRKNASKRYVGPRLQTVKMPMDNDVLKIQNDDQTTESLDQMHLKRPSNIHRKKLRKHKRTFGKLLSKNTVMRTSTGDLAIEKTPDPGKPLQTLESNIRTELEAHPLRKKYERWDLKPLFTDCGKILVPHGCVDMVHQIQALKERFPSTNGENVPEQMSVDVPINAHDSLGMEQQSAAASEVAVDEIQEEKKEDDESHHGNVVSSLSPLRHAGDVNSNSEDSSKNDAAEAVQQKRTHSVSTMQFLTKEKLLLSKLKDILLRGKRKSDLISDELAADSTQEPEPCLKKSKVCSDSEMLKNNEITSLQDSNLAVMDVSKTLSVDLSFAQALGLNARETTDTFQKNMGQDTEPRKPSSATREQSISDNQPQLLQRPPSISPKSSRIKTLINHQGISAEHVKKKWWLHFQTLGSSAGEKHNYKERVSDSPVRKAAKKKMHTACPSTDALNLLADLALRKDQVPPQQTPEPETNPESILKKCDLSEDVSSAEQESVLHALLRKTTARPTKPLKSPSPSHLVGGSELVGLVFKEHAYSLPSSSSELLVLPGTPFQVSPLTGSTTLLHHHQTMYENRIQTPDLSVGQVERDDHNHRNRKHTKEHLVSRRKFRHSRNFVDTDGSVQVTRQWKENYDFNLDSKFPRVSEDRAIMRALHGPWDFSTQDSCEEVQLIVHMWIGLFYSRSTARFFDVDSNFASYPWSEESDSLEMSGETVPAETQSELNAHSFATSSAEIDTSDLSNTRALDLSKEDFLLDQGPVLLDLSLRNTSSVIVASNPPVNREETPVYSEQKEVDEILKSPVGLDKCYRKTAISINDVNDVRNIYESKRTLQKIRRLKHSDSPSAESDGTLIPVQEETGNVSTQPDFRWTDSGIVSVLHGSNNKRTDMKVDSEKSEAREMSLVQKTGTDLSKSKTDPEVPLDKKAGDVVNTVEHDEMEFKDGENCGEKENLYQEDNIEASPKVIHRGGESTNKDSGTVCDGDPLENVRTLAWEEPKAVSPGQAEKDQDRSGCEVKVTEENYFKKHNGSREKDIPISAVDNGRDWRVQLSPVTWDKSESVTQECITQFDNKAPLDEQLPRTDSVNTACCDVQSMVVCASGSSLTDDHTTSEKACHSPSMDPIPNEPAVEANSESVWVDKAASPMSAVLACSLQGSILQETGNQKEIVANFSFGARSDDTKSIEGEGNTETQKESSHHQSHDEVLKRFKTEKTLIEERDVTTDKTRKGLEGIHIGAAIPVSGIDTENTIHPDSKEAELSPRKISVGDRLPALTKDEKQHGHVPCSGPSSGTESCSKITQKYPSRSCTPVMDERPPAQTMCDTSTDNMDASTGCALHSDVELRTQRVLLTLDKFLSKSSPSDKSTQIETAEEKNFLDQSSKQSSTEILTCSATSHKPANFMDKTINNTKPVVVSASASQELHTESTDSLLISPLDCLDTIKPKIDQDSQKTSSVTQSDTTSLYSQRPVMALKSSKKDESPADRILEERLMENSVMSTSTKTELTKMPVVTSAAHTSMLVERKTKGFNGESAVFNAVMQAAREFHSENSRLSEVKPNSVGAKSELQHSSGQDQRPDIPSSTLSAQSSETANSFSELVDGNQTLTHTLIEKAEQRAKENTEMDQAGCSGAWVPLVDYKDTGSTDNSLNLGPHSSLLCTVFNACQNRSLSLLEYLSQRCQQDDITEALMERECLIFTEKMKQLVKRGPSEEKTPDDLKLPPVSPVTVQFSNLEEQEDSVDLLEAPTFVGQKIQVDMSGSNIQADQREEGKTDSQKLSQGSGNALGHEVVSNVTAECATLYTSMMDNICDRKGLLSRQKDIRNDKVHPRNVPRDYFDFCGHMKRELDNSFRSTLNSVVKKSSKTKNRFYILVTSDDAFFEETKGQLQAKGHTAVQPSQFFLGKDCSSSLLILLRNEDIAENICEIPHLLELKRSPGVLFAGIDEPDDVVNHTYQELFLRGGFIMLDQAALDRLSLSHMRKISDVLQELSKTGKWKWMLHYRDSRRLKENARLSAEAKEKKHFLNCCQEAGLLEVLPYHECDLMSRDGPEYLSCLVRLQVQNISARFPVFVTDTATDGEFGRNGIFTMTVNSFLTSPPSESFPA